MRPGIQHSPDSARLVMFYVQQHQIRAQQETTKLKQGLTEISEQRKDEIEIY